MKPIIQRLTIAAFSTLSLSVHAQTEPTWRNDPTYSVHNYKHANKVAAVKGRALEPGITVNSPKPGVAHFANYKMSVTNQTPVGGIVLPHTPDTNLAGRNYKMSRPFLRPASLLKPATDEKTASPASIISE